MSLEVKSQHGDFTVYLSHSPIPFFNLTSEDWEKLGFGDSIVDTGGAWQYVNGCSGCGQKFLSGTLILVPYYCEECKSNWIRYGSKHGLNIIEFFELLDFIIDNVPDFMSEEREI